MTRTTMKPRASLTVRIVLAVMAALLVMADRPMGHSESRSRQ